MTPMQRELTSMYEFLCEISADVQDIVCVTDKGSFGKSQNPLKIDNPYKDKDAEWDYHMTKRNGTPTMQQNMPRVEYEGRGDVLRKSTEPIEYRGNWTGYAFLIAAYAIALIALLNSNQIIWWR